MHPRHIPCLIALLFSFEVFMLPSSSLSCAVPSRSLSPPAGVSVMPAVAADTPAPDTTDTSVDSQTSPSSPKGQPGNRGVVGCPALLQAQALAHQRPQSPPPVEEDAATVLAQERFFNAFVKKFGKQLSCGHLDEIDGAGPEKVAQAHQEMQTIWDTWRSEQRPEYHALEASVRSWAEAGVGTHLESAYALQHLQHLGCLADSSLRDVVLDVSELPSFHAPMPGVTELYLELGNRLHLPDFPRCEHVTALVLSGLRPISSEELSEQIGQFPNLEHVSNETGQPPSKATREEVTPEVGAGGPTTTDAQAEQVLTLARLKIRQQLAGKDGEATPSVHATATAFETLYTWEVLGARTSLAVAYQREAAKLRTALHDLQSNHLELDLAQLPDVPEVLPAHVAKLEVHLGDRVDMPSFPVCPHVTQLSLHACGLRDAKKLSEFLTKFPRLESVDLRGCSSVLGILKLKHPGLVHFNVQGLDQLTGLDLRGIAFPKLPPSVLGLSSSCRVWLDGAIGKPACDSLEETMSEENYRGPQRVRIGAGLIEVDSGKPQDESRVCTTVVAGELGIFDLMSVAPHVVGRKDLLSNTAQERLQKCLKSLGPSGRDYERSVLDWASKCTEPLLRRAYKANAAHLLMVLANPNLKQVTYHVESGLPDVPAPAKHVHSVVMHLGDQDQLPNLPVCPHVTALEINATDGLPGSKELSDWLEKFPRLDKLSVQGARPMSGTLRLSSRLRKAEVDFSGLQAVLVQGVQGAQGVPQVLAPHLSALPKTCELILDPAAQANLLLHAWGSGGPQLVDKTRLY
jgi:hypothetical protein